MKTTIFALILMGFSSLIVQTLLIREFLIIFYGNELTIGIILGEWIILEALGSKFFTKPSLKIKKTFSFYALLQLAIAIYLPIGIFLIRNIKNIFGLNFGEGTSINQIVFFSIIFILPLAIFDGGQFPFGTKMLQKISKKELESAGYVYILEAIGFIIAGPIFYILITKYNSFSIAIFLCILNIVSAILLLNKKISDFLDKIIFGVLIFFLIGYIFLFKLTPNIDKFLISKQWKGQKVLSYKNSIYSNLVLTKSKEQYTFYSNGIPIITIPFFNTAYIEELVHFSMLSNPNPKNILLIGGGAGGLIKELIKYPIENITYLELDPELIKQIKNFPIELTKEELTNKKVKIKYIDARRFLKITKSKYDVIIINLPMPSTLQLNRFYTKEFFDNIKSILNTDGVFAFCLPSSLSYINQEIKNLNGSILNTLEDIFFVNVIPGDFNIYIATNKNTVINPYIFSKRLKEKNIQTQLLTEYYIQYRLGSYWQNWFYNSMKDYKKIRKNLDFLPTATFYSILYWNSIFSPNLGKLFKILDKIEFRLIAILMLISALVLFILRLFNKINPFGFIVCTSGFFGLSLELIFIYVYQVFYGFVFSHIVFLTASFMLGLTLGGWYMNKNLIKIKEDIKKISKIEIAIISYSLILIPLLLFLKSIENSKISFIFFILQIISGFFVGSEFPLANKIYSKNPSKKGSAGILYSLDLLGAFFAVIISVIFIPIIGIINTFLFIIILKTISLGLLVLKKIS